MSSLPGRNGPEGGIDNGSPAGETRSPDAREEHPPASGGDGNLGRAADPASADASARNDRLGSDQTDIARAVSVEDARTLLGFAARQGLLSDGNLVSPILDMENAMRDPQRRLMVETAFWPAFSSLARLVQPASVESLRATLRVPSDPGKPGGIREKTVADRAVRRYTLGAILVFTLLALFQVYWLIGTSLLADIDSTIAQLNELIAQLNEPKSEGTASAIVGATAADSARAERIERARMEAKRKTLRANLEKDYELLASWNLWQEPWLLRGNSAVVSPTPDAESLQKANALSTEKAKFALDAIQRFLLPLFYGLIGSLIYVLRSLSNEIKLMSYRPENEYGVRVLIGGLAGVAINWVFADPSSISKSLSPVALAFLAGYSVDILFTAMDRMISAFSTSKGEAIPNNVDSRRA